ncbi:UDP-N-acetylmuramate dehydrogenase [Candidatus Falkowbacteria bacterium]|nr:UDP-N-acetylmuramate dehydrogenase [Candidatus Falkowbacteria bacterium]
MIYQLKQKLGDKVKENEILAPHTTFQIGGPAKYFFEAKNNAELLKAIKAAEELKLDYFLLGGGSNILVSDKGIDKFVIKQSNDNFKINGIKIFCESGALIIEVLDATLTAGLVGWPWAAGLPGTVGGAIRGNAGAYGEGMSDITESVEVYQNGKIKNFTNSQMGFSYRHSIAKEENLIILSCVLKLKKGDTGQDRELVDKYNKRRQDTQPVPSQCPNPGCAFKNIDLSKTKIDKKRVMKKLDITEAEWQEATKFGKLPISFIFDRLGLKGKTIGGAQVSEKHAAFIINTGQARAEHVVMLMSDLKMRARNELGLALEEEIQLVGF